MTVQEVFDILTEEFNKWHETFVAGFDSHGGHCCSCAPYQFDSEIVIDNRYPGYAEKEVYEIWEHRNGIRVIIKDDDSNTVSFLPYSKLQELGFRLVEKKEIELYDI